MIANASEYKKAQEDFRDLEARLLQLQEHLVGSKGLTKAGRGTG
jgi:hypothetical protein